MMNALVTTLPIVCKPDVESLSLWRRRIFYCTAQPDVGGLALVSANMLDPFDLDLLKGHHTLVQRIIRHVDPIFQRTIPFRMLFSVVTSSRNHNGKFSMS
jgi:hypothetical protein